MTIEAINSMVNSQQAVPPPQVQEAVPLTKGNEILTNQQAAEVMAKVMVQRSLTTLLSNLRQAETKRQQAAKGAV